MEQLIRQVVIRGFKIEFVLDPLNPENILIDVRRGFYNRRTMSVPPSELEFKNRLQVGLEELIKNIEQHGDS